MWIHLTCNYIYFISTGGSTKNRGRFYWATVAGVQTTRLDWVEQQSQGLAASPAADDDPAGRRARAACGWICRGAGYDYLFKYYEKITYRNNLSL